MNQCLAWLPFDVDVSQNHFIDTVVIPLVMRRHLINPFRLAAIEVTRKNRHRPLVITGALRWVPGAGVPRAVVNQVGGRVIAVPAPSGAATDFPLITLPCFERRVLADRRHLSVGPGHGGVGIHQHFGIWPDRIAFPDLLAGLDVIGSEVAPHAKLATADARQNLVFENVRCVGVGLANLRVAVLDFPDFLTRFLIERDQCRISLLQKNLTVAIGDPAIDRVAAHDRNHSWILLRFVLPAHGLIFKIDRKHFVRKRAVYIHGVADDERAALVAAQDARRKRPRHLQVLNVAAVDLLQCAVAVISIVARLHGPVFRARCRLV